PGLLLHNPHVHRAAVNDIDFTNRRCPLLRCNVLLDILDAGGYQPPVEHLLKIVEASVTNPTVIINCHKTLVLSIGIVTDHKFGRAELTVIMVPFRIQWILAVGTMAKVYPH
ncbi:MAG: hypothetical protein ACKO9H_05960, partial [Planctomycetota bacterium]